ncbi:DUF4450 domain-containing protein [uncultured Draconibacterium sp.]|uniref:DUF4450 domain-containing protein n=1 Tax=uncultured Draconibacterium sp. TaxID=1573823 RepID=UPI0032618472
MKLVLPEKVMKLVGLVFFVSLISCNTCPKDQVLTTYQTDGEYIIGNSIDRYNNRPLYVNNTNGLILTGDRPLIRFVKYNQLLGNLVFLLKNEEDTLTISDFNQIKSKFSPGQMKWEIRDSSLNDFSIAMNVLPTADGVGMAVQLELKNLNAENELMWFFGGAKTYPNENLLRSFDIMGHPELMTWKEVGDAKENPVYSGALEKGENVLNLIFKLNEKGEVEYSAGEEAEVAFTYAQNKLQKLLGRMKISTPDPYLNVMAKTSLIAVDATWYPPVFVHACMTWNVPLPGWRTIFGGTMYGWHERVREQADYYIASQVKESIKTEAKADPKSLLTEQHPDSRFYGVGRITQDQKFYNMQSQFFDQLIQDYRWTNNPELIATLREALELHLLWLRECFDPDGDGTYESYLNSWPSDSQWYNGGGTAEETSYAYRGHLAARDMARNAGDKEAEEFHTEMLAKIRKGFFEKLWVADKGHSGAYREQGGHKRLHEDPWLYSIFLPVDAGLTSQEQSIESVYYSEWALQNDTVPMGGRQVWFSNWVPGIWSVRERWPGDNYHLALSYYQAGLPTGAWDIFRGTYTHTAFNHNVPGNLGGQQGGTDFGDCVHTFSRTLVEGLFGFKPDYPNGKVTINPQFPDEWDFASIALPDFKVDFKKHDNTLNYKFEIRKTADMLLELPVLASKVNNITLNGEKADWDLVLGLGCFVVKIELKEANTAEVKIEIKDSKTRFNPEFIEGNWGEKLVIAANGDDIVGFNDPQGILSNANIEKGVLQATLTGKKGYHTIIAKVNNGNADQLRVYRVKINDPEGDAKQASRYLTAIPQNAEWENIEINALHNADVKAIYKQQYLSPRPNTVSARLGVDGYSPWTFWHWKSTPPEIRTEQVANMLDQNDLLATPQGVPFIWNSGEQNISFTSMWDNYPAKINFPVNSSGKAIYFLVAGSTNIMQCQIANAVIRLNYTDGQTDSLELIPPVNYWNLSTISSNATAPGQGSRNDYTAETDAFCMPDVLPETVQLGENCRAMLLNLKMRDDVELESITLETLSQEVVVGLIGATVLK